MIVAGEAAANGVEHATADHPAGAPPVQITLTARADRQVRLTVTDTGTWRLLRRTGPSPPRHPWPRPISCTH